MKKKEKIIFRESHIELLFSGWSKILNVSNKLIIPYRSINKLEICSYSRPDAEMKHFKWIMPKKIEGTFFYDNSPCYLSIEEGERCLHIQMTKGTYKNVFIEDKDIDQWLSTIEESIKKERDRTKKRKLV